MKNKKTLQLLMIGVLVTLFGMFISCSHDDGCSSTSKKQAPTAPALKTPENKAKLSSGEEIKLMWEASTDQDKDPITYNVYLSGKDNSDLELLKSEVITTFYTIDSILSEGTYQWKVEATDGKNKTSSDVFSFKVEKVYGLALSADSIYLKVENSKQVNITSGSGNYAVSNDKPEVATVDLSGTTINIIGKSEGTTTITVTDTKTNQTKQITVTVKNLVISKDRVDLKVREEESVSITSGSESYSVSSDKPEVAVAEVNGTEVKIIGKSNGVAIITITDNLTEETKQITVKVNSLEVSKTEVSVEAGKTTTVEITSGSGDYSIIVKNIEVAGSELSGTTLTIKGKSEGNTIVTVFDNVLKEIKQVTVTVTANISTVPDGVIVKDGVLKYWPRDKMPASGHIDIPDGVTSLGELVFRERQNLKSINIPNSVTSIGYAAFAGCSNLKLIKFSENLKSIGEFGFARCTSLTSIDIPDSVTKIDANAFKDCTNLKTVKLSENLTKIDHFTFNDCTSLTSIDIPNSVTELGQNIFNGCTSLEKVNISNSVKEIPFRTFLGCSKLRSINIPSSVEYIGYEVFKDCGSLENIEIPNSVKNIEASSFEGCKNLSEINLPPNLETISPHLFKGCKSLRSIVIPESVTTIFSYPFEGSSIEVLYLKPKEPPHVERMKYAGKIVVPKGSKRRYENNIKWGFCSPIIEED